MKKVLLLFFAILSVSIAASAKQGMALTEDFSSIANSSLTFGTTYNWDLEWYAMRADYKTDYYMAKKNYGTTTSPNYALGCTNGSYAGSTEAIIVTSAKAGTVSVDLIVCFGASYANGRGAIYKMTYNAESGRYEKGDKICSIDTSKYNTTTWTTMSGVLDEDGYIGIEFAYEYIDNYKNIPLLPNTVSGTITAKDGVTTISGATVDLLDGNGDVAYTTTSGENGTYSFGETVADGDYTLRVTAEGYLTYTATAATTISDDKTDLNASLEPKPKSIISGTVVRNDVDVDAALAGIAVQLLAGETVVANATSDADGSYSFEIKGALADAGYKLHVAATDYFQEFTADVTPVYQSSVTENIGLDPVLLEYVAVIENEKQEALEGAAITVVKKATKTIDSFEYLKDYSDVATALKANGWLAVTATGLTLAKSTMYVYDGKYSIKVPNETMGYTATFVRAAKAGTVSLKAAKESSTGTIYVYKMTDNGDGTYTKSGDPITSKTDISSSYDWSDLTFTLTEDCIIGFVVKRSYIDYYVNDFGASSTAAPAYAAPALADESGDTPSTIKITKDPIDLKTFTIAIPKVDYSDETYTATASATGATLKDTGASTDVWDFKFSDEKHVSVFTGGTPTGVSDISVDSAADADAEYYTLQGVRVTNPHSGIYICRRGSATSKVLIR